MPYGTIKVDTITFTDGGVDKSVAISGLVQNPTFTGNVTVTGTVSGATVRATTVSGVTISGTTINAASGVFTTQISGAVVVAPAGLVGTPSVQVGTGASVAPGFYGAGTDQLGISVAGSSRLVVDSVGQIRIVTLGSAAAPALVIGNDLNTGLYSLGADQVAISTAGTGRLFVDASGNVGIGTSSPDGRLEINDQSNGVETFPLWVSNQGAGVGTRATIRFDVANSYYGSIGGGEEIGIGSSVVIDAPSAGGVIRFTKNNKATEIARFDSLGRLGIGTSSPNRLFESSAATVDNFARINTTGATKSGVEFANGGAVYSQLYFNNVAPYDLSLFQQYSTGSLILGTNNTERLRIDSSGCVGIGTTILPGNKLTVGNGNSSPDSAIVKFNTGDTNVNALILSNWTGSATNYGPKIAFDNSTRSSWLIGAEDGGGSFIFWDKTLGNNERLRIDSSGRLLVGTSSSRFYTSLGDLKLQVEGTSWPNSSIGVTNNQTTVDGAYIALAKTRGTSVGSLTSVQSGDLLGSIWFQGADGTALVRGATINGFVDGNPGTSDMPGALSFATTADGASSPTEQLRITNAGRLLANMTTTPSAGGVNAQHGFSHSTSSQWSTQIQHTTTAGNAPFGLAIKYTAATPNNTSSDFLYCEDATAVRASIRSNGGLANYQANNVNLSDINAKKDISPAAGTWDCIKEWEIVNYRYKDQPDDAVPNLGVIAQQVAESCPEVITVFEEAKDDQAEKLGIKEQQMYWMAIKALQEAQVRIEQLEAKVAALESA